MIYLLVIVFLNGVDPLPVAKVTRSYQNIEECQRIADSINARPKVRRRVACLPWND